MRPSQLLFLLPLLLPNAAQAGKAVDPFTGEPAIVIFKRTVATSPDGTARLVTDQSVGAETTRVEDCSALYEGLRARTPGSRIGAAAWLLEREVGRLAYGAQVLVDDAKMLCLGSPVPLPEPTATCAANGACAGQFVTRILELRSVVGPFVSWRTATTTGKGADAAYVDDDVSWNLSTGKPASLSDVFDEAVLVAALRDDALVRQSLGDFLERLTTSDEILSAMAERTVGRNDFKRFEIWSWNAKKGKAEVRIGYHPDVARGETPPLTFLSLVLPPKEGWRPLFDEAAKGGGFFGETEGASRGLYPAAK